MRSWIEANPSSTWILVAVALLALAILIGVSTARSRRSRERSETLRGRFGPEYDRTVDKYGRKGERVLEKRVERVAQMRFRELSDADRTRFTVQWDAIQAQFVDDPHTAVARANGLIKEVMRARGYASDTAFEQRVADLSVDHPQVVQHYRAAHALALSGPSTEANTEDLRQAVVHYRVLFADLLQPSQTAPTPAFRPAHA
jgi:hypothetical protein